VSVALGTHREMRMHQVVNGGDFGSTIFFPNYLITYTIFEEKKITEIKKNYVFWFSVQILSEIFLFLTRTERDMVKNLYWSPCKVHVIFV
jgi:hypothetical protein